MAHICNIPGKILCADLEAAEADCLHVKFVENLKLEDGSNVRIALEGHSDDEPSEQDQHKGEETKNPNLSKIGIISVNQDLSEKRKRVDSDKEFISPELLVPESVADDLTIHKNEKCNKATAFSIPVENCPPCPQLPKRLCSAKKSGKANIESLNKKQALAEKRRQQHKENRLKRIHERQEAARKLAQNVDTLLQQRALAQGVADSAVKRMSPSEILATAHLVLKNFRALSSQIGNDLTVKEKERAGCKECVEIQNEMVRYAPNKCPSSVAFTVICDGGNSPAKPKQAFKQQQKKRSTLTSEDLEDKQRQAEERRNKKKQLRAQRARENREALSAMAIDIEEFKKLQSATALASVNKDGDLLEENKEAAMLAEKLSSQFDRLAKRYSGDLKRAENFNDCQPVIFLGLS